MIPPKVQTLIVFKHLQCSEAGDLLHSHPAGVKTVHIMIFVPPSLLFQGINPPHFRTKLSEKKINCSFSFTFQSGLNPNTILLA